MLVLVVLLLCSGVHSKTTCECLNTLNNDNNCTQFVTPDWAGRFSPEPPGFYVFTLNWPPTYCSTAKGTPCNTKAMSAWTKDFKIHGLWPNFRAEEPGSWISRNISQGYPMCCAYAQNFPVGYKFDGTEVMTHIASNHTLLADLQNHWPDSKAPSWSNSTPTNPFFAYEYDKHGTCAIQTIQPSGLNPVPGVIFAAQTLALKKRTSLLRALNLSPFESFRQDVPLGIPSDLNRKLQRAYPPGSFYFTCKKTQTAQYLWEIRVCYDIAFNFMQCPKSRTYFPREAPCADTKDVMLMKWN